MTDGLERFANAADPRSAALVALVRALDTVSPRTLHWTVSEVDDGAAAVERLRLLAPAEDHDRVSALLRDRSFRIVTLASWHRVPDASDWYSVDETDATLLNVCLQRQLVLGSSTSGWLMIERIPDTSATPSDDASDGRSPARSLALMLCERTLRGASRPGSGTQRDVPDEMRRSGLLHAAFSALFGSESATGLRNAAIDADDASMRGRLLALTPHRSSDERLRERARRARCRLAALNRSGPRLPLLAHRERTGPTLVIAVIGSDGSGKSSVSRWLAETLDTAFGARFLYFGTGDGPGSPIRRALNALKQRSRFGTAATPPGKSGAAETKRSSVDTAPTPLRLIWATVVGWERAGKMRALARARQARFVVVTDRYPQNEQAGIHDGPRLDHLLAARTGGLGGVLARLERSLYAWLARRVPDRVLLLDVPLELARQRRPEEPVDELARRITVARSLRYGDAPRLVIDAAEPLATVKARALRAALDALSPDSTPTAS